MITIRILLHGQTVCAASFPKVNRRHLDRLYSHWQTNAVREHQPYQMQIVTPIDETLIDFRPCD